MQDDKNFDVNTFKMDRESYKSFLIEDDDIDLDLDDDEYNDEVLVFHNK